MAELVKADIPCSSGAGGVGSIPANSYAQNVPSFRSWRFEMKRSILMVHVFTIQWIFYFQYFEHNITQEILKVKPVF